MTTGVGMSMTGANTSRMMRSARSLATPKTMRSGVSVSSTAKPSRRNSGFQHSSTLTPSGALARTSAVSRSAVPTGTVDLPTSRCTVGHVRQDAVG